MKVLIVDPYGDCLDLAMRALDAGHAVVHYVSDSDKKYALVGEGLTDPVRDFKPHVRDADLIFLADNTKWLHFFDGVRAEYPNKAVFGPTWATAQWEQDRLLGMKVLEAHGIECPPTRTFNTADEAIKYVRKHDGRLVCKPCGDADKALSYVSKAPEDMEYMLKKWDSCGKIRS